jgi:V/A-type H+-transporting ATPase subunit I
MIVRMKKLTLLVAENYREDFLAQLRRLGVIHIKHINPPSADDINLVEETISQTKKAVSILESCDIPKAAERVIWKDSEVSEQLKEITSVAAEREDLIRSLRYIEDRIEQFKPWGSFDPRDLRAFEGRNINIRLYRTTRGALKRAMKERRDIHLINEDKQYAYIAQICQTQDEELPFEEVKFPEESFEKLYDRHEYFKNRIEEIENDLRAKARAKESLREYGSLLEQRKIFLNVVHGMGREKGFSYLQGYCPVDNVKRVKELAEQKEFGYLAEEPGESEDVPTLIRNPKWINIISPVFKFMNTMPGYKEYDISFPFLIFFSLFFAMLIGDGGYGFLFLGLTYFASRKLKNIPREPFILMYVLSIATIVWGAITGTWFGAEEIAKLPLFNALIIERVNSFVGVNQEFVIYLCFIIGAVQLTIAHLIKAFRMLNTLKALAEIGWILTLWGLFFAAGTLVIGRAFPAFAQYLLIAGVVLIVFFSNPQKNILKGALTSLATSPLKVISSFADVVSYIRLFAVGYATVAVASGFNEMALMLGFNNIASSLGAALIMLLGHSINMILGLMSVIVHGIRLNMLEFSGQIEMEWAGTEYNPFREKEVIE